MSPPRYDAVVIGAGYGGLAAALTLSRQGAKVLLAEALRYPGGCASTFPHRGYRFEAGATLFSGFDDHQLFGRWVRELELPVRFERLEPAIRFRSDAWTADVGSSRRALVDRLAALPGAPVRSLRRFFALQARVADTLWPLFDRPERLPPLSWSGAAWHLARSHRYPALLPLVGRPLGAVLDRLGLSDFAPLRTWCDALCQITIQTEAARAEAPFALATLDYPFRGTGHIHGGIGALGDALIDALRRSGVEVRLAARVRSLRPEGGGWRVDVRGEEVLAGQVAANTPPHGLSRLLGEEPDSLRPLRSAVETGWGAAMLYLAVHDHDGLLPGAHHVQAVVADGPLHSGNHLFCSISARDEGGRAPKGQRTATVSTHVPMGELLGLPPEERGAYVQRVQDRMRAGLFRRIPEVAEHVRFEAPASPRTFERFTRRPHGFVGGVPRVVGPGNYRGLFPRPVRPGLWLVGDSVFPGQSTLATAVGGARTARAMAG